MENRRHNFPWSCPVAHNLLCARNAVAKVNVPMDTSPDEGDGPRHYMYSARQCPRHSRDMS